MRIFGNDAIEVLKDKRPGETLSQAAKRLFPDKYGKLADREDKGERIKNPTVSSQIKRTYDKHLYREMCPSCWKRLCRGTLREYGRYCSVCGAKDNLTVHHIVPRDEDGRDRISNLMPLCSVCHDYVECHDDRPRTREKCIRVGQGRISE